jgi:hypothetical protein
MVDRYILIASIQNSQCVGLGCAAESALKKQDCSTCDDITDRAWKGQPQATIKDEPDPERLQKHIDRERNTQLTDQNYFKPKAIE